LSNVNLIIDKIREEHKKGLPSKRKILSYLLDLLNKDKYPSLSDVEFYDIVGETYNLNLDYKLNLKMLFYPIYNALKKKIKKLHGDEKRLEMEQYLIKNFGLFGTEHILNKIKEKFEEVPSNDLNLEILAIFYDILSKEEYQDLSDSDFNFIVRETFKFNPEFFINSLNWDLRKRMKKENRLIMDKYIIEKFNLKHDEHIIYECNGKIKLEDSKKGSLSLTSGSIFLTNHRIIAQGICDAKGPLTPGVIAKHILSVAGGSGIYIRPEATEILLESSLTYGYQFPIRNHSNLKKTRNGVCYRCVQDNQFKLIQIDLPRKEQVDIIFKILSK